jgi:hypothetical protein
MSGDEREAWTDVRIREAFIYDGGESEYHDPINGAREQRRIAGAIFDAWLIAHDAEVRRQGPNNDEWQYGERSLHSMMVWLVDRERRPDIWEDVPPARRVRRRKAGPWEPVETASDAS